MRIKENSPGGLDTSVGLASVNYRILRASSISRKAKWEKAE